jgi:UDP-2,4-diacetamido-2,4,6-trideoxy-beta-L-altropyranose hydrolase
MIDVLFRVDDGPGIGAGHLMRCSAMMEAVAAVGGRSHVLAARASPLHPALQAAGASVTVRDVPVGSAADLAATRETAAAVAADWLVVDGYAFGTEWLDALADEQPTLYLDDTAARDARAALVLNQNPGAEQRYRRAYPRAGRALLGLDYFLLRGAWRAAVRAPEPQRLLVTLGGDDRDNRALALMRALLDDGRTFRADVVSSAPDSGFREAAELAAAAPRAFELHRAPADLVPLAARAAVAVCAGGVTAVEIMSLQVPEVVVVTADNQLPGALALATAGQARLALPGERQIREAAQMALDEAALAGMTRNPAGAGTVVDGRGAERVVSAMEQIREPSTSRAREQK